MDHEYFYIYRGNYFYEIGCYTLAIGNYKKALNEHGSRDKFVKPSIAHCHQVLGNYDEALRIYREEYKKSDHPDIVLGLMCAELNIGNDDRGLELFRGLIERESELDDFHKSELKRFKKRFKKEKLI